MSLRGLKGRTCQAKGMGCLYLTESEFAEFKNGPKLKTNVYPERSEGSR